MEVEDNPMLRDWVREGWSSSGLDVAHAEVEKLACDTL